MCVCVRVCVCACVFVLFGVRATHINACALSRAMWVVAVAAVACVVVACA